MSKKNQDDFEQTSRVEHIWLKKRTIYDGEQYIDVKATVANNNHFDLTVTGSQKVVIKTSMTRECLEALVRDLDMLLDRTREKDD